MRLDRHHADEPLVPGARLRIEGEEGRHLVAVLRRRVGDRVMLFDGRGREAEAVLVETDRRGALVEVGEPVEIDRRPAVDLRVAVALPKGGAADDVLRRALEIGASRVQPLLCRRGVHRPEKKDAGRRAERFRRLAVATMKLSGRNSMPQLEEPGGCGELVLDDGELGLFGSLEPGAANVHRLLSSLPRAPLRATVVVGPEGGFAPEEEEALRAAGCRATSLGDLVLRVETAVCVLGGLVATLPRDPAP